MVPLDLGPKGSCQIGGNVSTMAGGLRLYRYGNLRNSVLGLEVVLADGTVLNALNTLRKDNSGYDVKQLFMGSEGTLGIVTGVAIALAVKPLSVQTALLALKDFESVLEAQSMAKQNLNEILSGIEFWDRDAQLLTESQLGCKPPFSNTSPFYLLIETHGSDSTHDREKLMTFIDKVMESSLVEDGLICESETQAQDIWKIREGIGLALVSKGAVYKYDVSLPHQQMYRLVEESNQRLAAHGAPAIALGFGHLGDGNLHLNISTPKYDEKIQEILEPFVYEWTAGQGGSISAEHGIGQMKVDAVRYSKSFEARELMRKLKGLLDPQGILNPYKVVE
eukprot:c8865_g1_i3.p1 GENE.c8865_g1_i3~~c8865_g1_i3.p1  ORF type:complete len:336 (-),score=100.09 c8865_g1_i3:18-1025(-)